MKEWEQLPDGFRRKDGVMIIRRNGSRYYVILLQTGEPLSQKHGRNAVVQPRLYGSMSGAMAAVRKYLPLKDSG